MASKVWFITGASSGFGRIMTNLVLESGNKCVATSIEPSALDSLVKQYGPSRLLSLHTDVTKPSEVQEAFRISKEKFGGLDVVFSNAGSAFADEVEDCPDDKARKLFEVNFWGVVNVMKESLKMFRDVNEPGRGGRLMQMASVAGITGWASLGYYCASKHAVEGLTKTLVQELKPEWNIQASHSSLAFVALTNRDMQATIIEPGFFRTAILDVIQATNVEASPAYAGGVADQNRAIMQPENILGDPKKAMQLVLKVAGMEKMPLHLPIGADSVAFFRAASDELKKAADEWEAEASNTMLDGPTGPN